MTENAKKALDAIERARGSATVSRHEGAAIAFALLDVADAIRETTAVRDRFYPAQGRIVGTTRERGR